jgi:hypothetical protein
MKRTKKTQALSQLRANSATSSSNSVKAHKHNTILHLIAFREFHAKAMAVSTAEIIHA